MPRDASVDALLAQRRRLSSRIEEHLEEREALMAIIAGISDQLARDEHMLAEVESLLGTETQLRLEQADLRLRGRRLEEVATQVLAEEVGNEAEVHYRDWFALLRARGYLVGGKEPINTFLAQINRSEAIERIGRRSGRYRLARAA
jgi:hypothetical protein